MFFVAGPCVIEGPGQLDEIASALSAIADRHRLTLYFKASFDKANRTRGDAFRGPGLAQGLQMLADVKSRYGLQVITDVHGPEQCAPVAEVADVLQVPAFLCRQTDLIVAAGQTGRVVNLKRGQFLDPRAMVHAVQKLPDPTRAWVTERGTTFGHGDLVFDPRSLIWLRACGVPVVYDCTHSVQSPPGSNGGSGGHRHFARPLARAAVAVGVQGLFTEVHPDPSKARSDAATQLDPSAFEQLVIETLSIAEALDGHPQT
ncbi:MAG: 3-deoxy-8-phosphooctulonate synthase [Bradymonadia bacterium]